jgi:prepilin-type N-terminal cleavage/methylation domain-containing protein/prepilin-type processing-associated H-X9-DG protein
MMNMRQATADLRVRLRAGKCAKTASGDGFTLVELLVAIAIVIVLAALSFVAIRSTTASGHRATCVNIMRQYGLAMNGYLGDNHNMMPYIQVNLQKPFYRHQNDWHIFAKLYPYLGLESQSKPTALPDELVCPAWRKRFPNWNSDGSGTVAGNAYFMNQDQSINGRRIYGTQQNAKNQYGPMSYAVAVNGTEKTPASRILFLADGHHPTEKEDPVHGKMRSYLFLDFHVESLPADQVELFISP